jgi:hypothetical protein
MSRPLRSLRLLRRTTESLDNLSGNSGEIFYDSDNRTLRVYSGIGNDRAILSTRSWTVQYVEDNTFSGNYNDLTNLPSIPADTADLTNSAGFITQADVDQSLSGIDLTGLATVATTGDYNDLINTPIVTPFSGDYLDLTNLPTLFSGDYNDLINKPTFSGSYDDLTNLPTLFSGSYDDLTDKPTIPSLTGYATESFVGTAISSLVDAAPGALDTLNELAAALNDDANFASTVSLALQGKEPSITSGTTSQYFRGDKTFQTLNATAVGLGNVTNESKATMFSSPTFTGTVSGVTATHVGLGNVTNESKATMFSSPTFTGTVSGVTATAVGLGNVTNESKATMFTTPTFTGTTTFQQTMEVVNTLILSTGVVEHNFTFGSVWVHTSISANFTANFTNFNTTDNRAITVALVLVQSATPRIPSAVQIGGTPQTINWQGGAVPTGNANKIDIVNFTFIRNIGTLRIIGSLSTFG